MCSLELRLLSIITPRYFTDLTHSRNEHIQTRFVGHSCKMILSILGLRGSVPLMLKETYFVLSTFKIRILFCRHYITALRPRWFALKTLAQVSAEKTRVVSSGKEIILPWESFFVLARLCTRRREWVLRHCPAKHRELQEGMCFYMDLLEHFEIAQKVKLFISATCIPLTPIPSSVFNTLEIEIVSNASARSKNALMR